MSQRTRKSGSLFLKSTSAVSLDERFSKILVDQLIRPRTVIFEPVLQRTSGSSPAALLVKKELLSLQTVKQRMRRSVWTRLGWQQVTRRRLSASGPRGFWSFRDKYRWRARLISSTYRKRGILRSRFRQRRVLSSIQKLTAGQHLRLPLPKCRGTASRGRSRHNVPTKKQLDAQLEDYMSLSKKQLDKQLDDYMSLSQRRLDAELDEYMSKAGEVRLWD